MTIDSTKHPFSSAMLCAVRRFSPSPGIHREGSEMRPDSHGAWVPFGDYATLAQHAQRERLAFQAKCSLQREELDNISRECFWVLKLVPAIAPHHEVADPYYAGYYEVHAKPARTSNLSLAARWTSSDAAQAVGRMLLGTLSCCWEVTRCATEPDGPCLDSASSAQATVYQSTYGEVAARHFAQGLATAGNGSQQGSAIKEQVLESLEAAKLQPDVSLSLYEMLKQNQQLSRNFKEPSVR